MTSVRKTINDVMAEAEARLERLEAVEAAVAVDAGALLIDVRAADSRRIDGVIPGSHHVPLSVLEWRVDPTSDHADPRVARVDAQLVLVCEHGYCSALAAARLHDLGFTRATDVIGGFAAWRGAGLPVSVE